jgi:hypothetical protein
MPALGKFLLNRTRTGNAISTGSGGRSEITGGGGGIHGLKEDEDVADAGSLYAR